MKEYKQNEIFQWEDRTLMLTGEKDKITRCANCYLDKYMPIDYCYLEYVCNDYVYFTNKLIFSSEGLTLQIKRKGCKVKVKVLELNDGVYMIKNDKFEIFKGNLMTMILKYSLSIENKNDKLSHTFPTEQEAIDWVDGLFSLRGE